MSEFCFKQVVKLKKNGEFRRAYSRGKSFVDPALVTYITKNRAGICRIGITATKKIGNAVKRNRAKRVITAAYRSMFRQLCEGGYDIVFVARGKTPYLKSTEIESIMRRHLEKAGLLNSN